MRRSRTRAREAAIDRFGDPPAGALEAGEPGHPTRDLVAVHRPLELDDARHRLGHGLGRKALGLDRIGREKSASRYGSATQAGLGLAPSAERAGSAGPAHRRPARRSSPPCPGSRRGPPSGLCASSSAAATRRSSASGSRSQSVLQMRWSVQPWSSSTCWRSRSRSRARARAVIGGAVALDAEQVAARALAGRRRPGR